MSLVFHFLLAITVIAGLMLVRIFVNRRAMRARLGVCPADEDCAHTGCIRHADAESTEAASTPKSHRRSAHHAH